MLLGAAAVAAEVNETGYVHPETIEGSLFWEPFMSVWDRWVRAAWPVWVG